MTKLMTKFILIKDLGGSDFYLNTQHISYIAKHPNSPGRYEICMAGGEFLRTEDNNIVELLKEVY